MHVSNGWIEQGRVDQDQNWKVWSEIERQDKKDHWRLWGETVFLSHEDIGRDPRIVNANAGKRISIDEKWIIKDIS